MEKVTLYVDADLVTYRMCAANQLMVYKHPYIDESFRLKSELNVICATEGLDKAEIYSDIVEYSVSGAQKAVLGCIMQVIDDLQAEFFQPTNIVFCFSDPNGTFRERIESPVPYKGNRTQVRPTALPCVISSIKTIVSIRDVPCHSAVTDDMEADDTMSILANDSTANSIIVTMDKDLLQSGIRVWDFAKRGFKDYVDPLHFFYHQLLIGDSSDGIVGCPGIGEKKAAKILGDLGGDVPLETWMFNTVLKEYTAAYEDEAKKMMLINADLLWIYRKEGVGYAPLITRQDRDEK